LEESERDNVPGSRSLKLEGDPVILGEGGSRDKGFCGILNAPCKCLKISCSIPSLVALKSLLWQDDSLQNTLPKSKALNWFKEYKDPTRVTVL